MMTNLLIQPLLFVAIYSAISPCAALQERHNEQIGPERFHWLNRISYGATQQTSDEYNKKGKSEFLDGQLSSPHPLLSRALQDKLDSLTITKKSAEEIIHEWQATRKAVFDSPSGPTRLNASQQLRKRGQKIAEEARLYNILLATYSSAQLKELMTWFWINHFNVFGNKSPIINWSINDFSNNVIRKNSLGNFKTLLSLSIRHPTMLSYLDNTKNKNLRANENFAREILELYSLGVNGGYSQNDVQEFSRILTGWGLATTHIQDNQSTQAEKAYSPGTHFNSLQHDYGDKQFLGHLIKGAGANELDQAIDIIIRHPSCSKFIAGKIASYFMGSPPSPTLLESLSASFRESNGSISDVLRTLIDSKEFSLSLNQNYKDPYRFITSSIRLIYGNRLIGSPEKLTVWLKSMNQSQFGLTTPDGYSLVSNTWIGAGAFNNRISVAQGIIRQAKKDKALNAELMISLPQRYALSNETASSIAKASTNEEALLLFLLSPEFNQY